ncbi:MAG: DUF3037 domain-containing protein [Methylococcales bacterium]|nr:DUF3037 domain-containing protein [Methylococcales bacterium]
MFWFDYALIRYTPNPKRGETINVGLIVFLETDIDVRVLSSSAKVRMLDGLSSQVDITKLQESMLTLSQLATTPDQQYDLLAKFNSGVFLSGKAKFAIDDMGQYQDKVAKLFSDLVKPFASKEKITHTARLATQLKNRFATLDILAKDASDLSRHKIVPNYLLSEKTGIYADFLLKHLTEVVDFNANDIQAKFKETSLKIMTFMAGKKELNGDVKRYFVYSATAQKETEITHHLNLVEDYCEKMFNVNSKEESIKYFEMIAEYAHSEIPRLH